MSFWVPPEELMESPIRQGIMELIRSYPGINFRKIADTLEVAPGTVQWHTDRLVKVGLIKSETVGVRRIFLPTDWSAQECDDARIAARFRDPIPASIFATIQSRGPSCIHQLQQTTGQRPVQIRTWIEDFCQQNVMMKLARPASCLAKACHPVDIQPTWADFPVGDL